MSGCFSWSLFLALCENLPRGQLVRDFFDGGGGFLSYKSATAGGDDSLTLVNFVYYEVYIESVLLHRYGNLFDVAFIFNGEAHKVPPRSNLYSIVERAYQLFDKYPKIWFKGEEIPKLSEVQLELALSAMIENDAFSEEVSNPIYAVPVSYSLKELGKRKSTVVDKRRPQRVPTARKVSSKKAKI